MLVSRIFGGEINRSTVRCERPRTDRPVEIPGENAYGLSRHRPGGACNPCKGVDRRVAVSRTKADGLAIGAEARCTGIPAVGAESFRLAAAEWHLPDRGRHHGTRPGVAAVGRREH